MIVNVTLYGVLREKLAKEARGRITLELPEDSRIQDARNALGIESPIICVLNGKNERGYEAVLHEGDEISFLLPVGGGASNIKRISGVNA